LDFYLLIPVIKDRNPINKWVHNILLNE